MGATLLDPRSLASALIPDLVLGAGTLLIVLLAGWRRQSDEHQYRVGALSVALLAITLAVVGWSAWATPSIDQGIIATDNFRWAVDAILLVGAIFTIPLAIEAQRRAAITSPETHVLVLFATQGMMLLAAARDLILVFLGIEVMSIAVYALAAINRRSARSAEAALKYFLLGAFSSAFLLYGMALVYGASGATRFDAISAALANPATLNSPMLKIGIGLLVVGFGFKVAAAPFHMWAPDAYDGAPTPYTAFMAASVKAAAFAAFLRVFVEALSPAYAMWHAVIWWLAVVTMIVGNVTAIAQRNIKRMLAYSSIAHAGYVLVAVVVGPSVGASQNVVTGPAAFLFYLFAYTLSTMGVFAVVAALSRRGEPALSFDEYNGLFFVRPGLTLAMSACLLALLGFPVFGGVGFWAKWYMIQAALRGGGAPQTLLVVALVTTSVISAAYYLYVITVMFMRPRPDDAPEPPPVGRLTQAVIGATVVLIFVLGFAPTQLLRGASQSTIRPPGARPVAGATAVSADAR
ncbi:NAD(P)H-quinone oxidoreductase subunit 2 [Gemmatirosa kalamazoonensis]|uniref:NADH-quinone oxidoreductase subunit N n=1 Tax=Gemmatirosa kalamazoonensis TaxID=861299 RepID=W0RIA2_9BACT|nr:NADH-quinone oxidoreductase subunit N [Gemmatirosa kalamazoonensis]AHG90819.1 NAD(P)H-quinone oxidoreductase subunit 2 [Gemmatirosa kalamazoonensis]